MRLRSSRTPPSPPDCRVVLGLRMRSNRAQAALVSAVKRGLEMECTLGAHFDEEFVWPTGPPHEVRKQATAAACRAIQGVLAKAGKQGVEALCIGLEDPGVWVWSDDEPEGDAHDGEPSPPVGYTPAIDATRLAETTGLSVLDAFAERDLLQGGLGGPLDPLPLWFLLRHPFRTRLLVQLEESVRIVYLPAGLDRHSAAGVLACDAGPGLDLLHDLAALITGQTETPAGAVEQNDGDMADCGELRPELLEAWLNEPWFDQPPPRWRPQGVSPERFVKIAREQLGEVECQRHDLLRTAVDLIAESVRLARVRFCPPEPLLDEVLLAGPGWRHPLLAAELARRFGEIPLTPVGDVGLPNGALGATASAVLALLWLEQIPANLPAITGVSVPRVLGRLTPGTPQNWNRLVRELAAAKGTRVSLRSAL